MNCRKVSQSLSAYIDGELPGVEHRLIHEHLTRCEACRAEQEGLLYTKRLVSRLRLKEPRPELPQAILQRLSADSRPRPSHTIDTLWENAAQWFRGFNPVGRNLAFGASLAAVGILFVAARVDSSDDIQWTPAPTNPMLLRAEMPDLASASVANPDSMMSMAMQINAPAAPLTQNENAISPVSSSDLSLPPSQRPFSAGPVLLPVSLQSVRTRP